MMNKVRKVMASVTLAMLVFALWASAGRSQDKPAGKNVATTQVQQAKTRGMTAEEKLVRDVYARLMRYQTAAVDELAAISEKTSAPDDYLTFELTNIHSGPIEDISGRPLEDVITAGRGDTLSLKPTYLTQGDGPAHAYYEVEWRNEQQTRSANETDTNYGSLGELLAASGNKFTGSDRYTSYQVTVKLGGKQRTYRALVLHHSSDGTVRSASEILDNITSGMNTVLSEESPRVRSPWDKYVKTALYVAVTRTIKETKEAGQPLIPADAPIGYLPGDDVSPNEKDSQTLAAETACTDFTITSVSPPELHVSTGDPAASHQIVVAFTPNETVLMVFRATKLGNPGGTSDATLAIGNQGTEIGRSPITVNVKASPAGGSIASVVNPDIGGRRSQLQSIVIVPPQILLQMMLNEARGLSSTTVRKYLGFAMKNRFGDSQYFSGQNTFAAAINAGATHDASLTTGDQPYLDDAVTVFWDTSGGGEPTHGCQGFWSPTTSQWQTVQQALNSGTTTLPSGIGIPFNYGGHNELTQVVYLPSVGQSNTQNAPSFLFVRKRTPGNPAVVQIG
jgi:hypothetical protein